MPKYQVKSRMELTGMFTLPDYVKLSFNESYVYDKAGIIFWEDVFFFCDYLIDDNFTEKGNVIEWKNFKWHKSWLKEVQKFERIELRPVITAKYYPCTKNKPARYRIKFCEQTKFMSVHQVDESYPYVAQALVEKFKRENGLNWRIVSAAKLEDGTYIFIG